MATPVDQSKMDVNNTSNSNSDTESAGGPQIKPARTMTQRISEELDTTLAFIPMLVCCFISGLTDGTIYGGEFFYSPGFSSCRSLTLACSLRNLRFHADW